MLSCLRLLKSSGCCEQSSQFSSGPACSNKPSEHHLQLRVVSRLANTPAEQRVQTEPAQVSRQRRWLYAPPKFNSLPAHIDIGQPHLRSLPYFSKNAHIFWHTHTHTIFPPPLEQRRRSAKRHLTSQCVRRRRGAKRLSRRVVSRVGNTAAAQQAQAELPNHVFSKARRAHLPPSRS